MKIRIYEFLCKSANRRIRIFASFATISAFVLLFFVLPRVATAITLSPPILDLTAAPGEKLTPAIMLENETGESRQMHGSVEAFGAGAEEGKADFYPSGTGLASWIKLEETDFTLLPGQSKKIFLSVNVGKDAKPGSYYAAVFWGTGGSQEGSSGAAVAGRVGTLIFLRVEGTVVENLELDYFRPKRKVFFSLPVALETKVINKGDVHLAPKGEIIIKTWTGKQVAALPWNESGIRVLPGTERSLETQWEKRSFFKELLRGVAGYYTASVHISYGSPVKEIGDVTAFWILPWQSFGIAILALAGLIGGLRFGVRRYNRWVIRKHLRQ